MPFPVQSYDLSTLLERREELIGEGLLMRKQVDDFEMIKYPPTNKPQPGDQRVMARSIILKNGNVVCMSPVRGTSIGYTELAGAGPTLEEFVEGTMVNVFQDPGTGKTMLATRWYIGGNNKFFAESDRTFGEMFDDALSTTALDISELPGNSSHSFVVKHPSNRIATAVSAPELWYIGSFEISGSRTRYGRLPAIANVEGIRVPSVYDDEVDPSMGWTGFVGGERKKWRTAAYERIRGLRGNTANSMFRFLLTRQDGLVPEYLKEFPEDKERFCDYEEKVQHLVCLLTDLALGEGSKQKISSIRFELKPHVWELRHGEWDGGVSEYVDSLPAERLAFTLNHMTRSPEANQPSS